MSSPSTSEIARTLHDADDGERFTLMVHGPETTFRWTGCRQQIRCVLDLLGARLVLADLDGGPDDEPR